eukprot:symbB.v1.2.036567.t1/scaffold5193.1/size29919/1
MASCDTSVLMHAGPVRRQRLGTRHVAACAFAMTCAGPFGVEAAVRCFGPGAFFVGLIVTMLGYVLPQIFMTCELSMMAPLSNSGVTCWISRAFGPKAGKCIGLNMLLYQVVDLATYTTVIVGYAESAGYELDGWLPRLAPVLAIALGLAVNLLAIDMAAEVFMMVLLLVLLPFLVALPWSVPHFPMAWAHTFESSEQSKDLNLFLSSLIWLNTGWDSFGNLAEDVAGPFELIHGLLYAALAAFVVYVLCTFQALTVDGSWEDGYLSVAYRHLWTPLGLWVCISAALANSLLYTSELAVVSRFFQALGGEGSTDVPRLLPSCFKKELSTGAPIVALLVMTVLQLERRQRVLVLGGWSPGPLDVLRARMDRVDFLEPNIPMPPSGCRWCLNPFCPLLLAVIFWLLPMVASTEEPAGLQGAMSWLLRLAALLAIPLFLRLLVAGLVWFSIKDGLWTTSRAIKEFHPD